MCHDATAIPAGLLRIHDITSLSLQSYLEVSHVLSFLVGALGPALLDGIQSPLVLASIRTGLLTSACACTLALFHELGPLRCRDALYTLLCRPQRTFALDFMFRLHSIPFLRLRMLTAVQVVDSPAPFELSPSLNSSRRGYKVMAAPMLLRTLKLLGHVPTRSSQGVIRRLEPESLWRKLDGSISLGLVECQPLHR